jgi:hypothetical protein
MLLYQPHGQLVHRVATVQVPLFSLPPSAGVKPTKHFLLRVSELLQPATPVPLLTPPIDAMLRVGPPVNGPAHLLHAFPRLPSTR